MAKDKLFAKAVLTIREIIQDREEHWVAHESSFGILKLDKVKNAAPKDQKKARKFLKIDVVDNLSVHLERSKSTGDNYDKLLFVSGLMLKAGEKLPTQLESFLAKHLLQEIKRPKKRGAPQNASRDIERFEIACDVKRCTDIGLLPTRSEPGSAISACDAVAEVLRLEGKKGGVIFQCQTDLDGKSHNKERQL